MHRICVISDDVYYLKGFSEAISESICTISFSGIRKCFEEIKQDDDDTFFIISLRSLVLTRRLVTRMAERGMNVIVVYDIPENMLYSHACFLSKRNSAEYITRFLMDVLLGKHRKAFHITPRQTEIVQKLTAGNYQKRLACDDECSVKTISGLKKTITRRIGFKTMNSLSLLFSEIIILSAKV